MTDIFFHPKEIRMGKMTQWEMRKKLIFLHTRKWYMYIPESVTENEMLKGPQIYRLTKKD